MGSTTSVQLPNYNSVDTNMFKLPDYYLKKEAYLDAYIAFRQITFRTDYYSIISTPYLFKLELESKYEEIFLWLQKATVSEMPEIYFLLGIMYDEGLGITKNKNEAMYYYLMAHDKGYDQATYRIGAIYDDNKDYSNAMKFYQIASDTPDALCRIGRLYYYGNGIKKNIDTALEYIQKAIDKNSHTAMIALGIIYAIDKKYEAALVMYQKAADGGDIDAKYLLASAYFYGKGVQICKKTAYRYATEAVDQGHAKAMNLRGIMFCTGINGIVDYDNAFKMFQMSDAKGYEYGTLHLAEMYEAGWGTKQCWKSAAYYYRKALEKGVKCETSTLTACIKTVLKKNFENDYPQVFDDINKYVIPAVNNGDTEMICIYGIMHEYGIGVERNFSRAKELYKSAYEKGHNRALKKLIHLCNKTQSNNDIMILCISEKMSMEKDYQELQTKYQKLQTKYQELLMTTTLANKTNLSGK